MNEKWYVLSVVVRKRMKRRWKVKQMASPARIYC